MGDSIRERKGNQSISPPLPQVLPPEASLPRFSSSSSYSQRPTTGGSNCHCP